jgi:carboxypeptidase Q
MLSILLAVASLPQTDYSQIADLMRKKGLTELQAHAMLVDLCKVAPHRLSGSAGAEKAIAWTEARLKSVGATNIRKVPCMVPKWVRGPIERASMNGFKLNICALGGSVGTPKGGIEAEVIEVKSLEEAEALGEKGRGKIIFYNRPFDPTLVTGAYGGAVNQRSQGAIAAAKSNAIGVLVRSMTNSTDDVPHTGAMRYAEGVKQIPAAALGIQSAERLSLALKRERVKVKLELSCRSYPDVPSANVIGEIVGSEKPNEVIVLGGHLDGWDKGHGAHDDGSGIVQGLEVLRLINALGLKPKRTIRFCAWMNEENGLRGATAYAEMVKTATNEKHIAAMESDSGGYMPRQFGVSESKLERVRPWEPFLRPFGIDRFVAGGRDADITPLEPMGVTLFSLEPENQRYFDVHHSDNDTIDKVHPRELQCGAIAMALLAWMLSEEGI